MRTDTGCGIAAMGFYLPEKEVDLKELAHTLNIPEFVVDALGAATVREAGPQEYPSDMAIRAAQDAIDRGRVDPLDIDLVIYCGAGLPDYVMPPTAGKIQEAVGARRAFGFDLVHGCAGLLTGLQAAKAYIALDEGIDTVLLAAGDKWSQFTRSHWVDSVFFGDGGGAAVVSGACPDLRLLGTATITRGEYHDLWGIKAGGVRWPTSEDTIRNGMHRYECLDVERARHEFKDIYVPVMVETVQAALRTCNLQPQDIAYFDMVNNNLKAQKALLAQLGIPLERSSADYLKVYGHFGAHDILFNLDRAVEDKRIKKGDYVAMFTAAIGFSWASAVLQY